MKTKEQHHAKELENFVLAQVKIAPRRAGELEDRAMNRGLLSRERRAAAANMRAIDRTLQRLRKAKSIVFDKTQRMWVLA